MTVNRNAAIFVCLDCFLAVKECWNMLKQYLSKWPHTWTDTTYGPWAGQSRFLFSHLRSVEARPSIWKIDHEQCHPISSVIVNIDPSLFCSINASITRRHKKTRSWDEAGMCHNIQQRCHNPLSQIWMHSFATLNFLCFRMCKCSVDHGMGPLWNFYMFKPTSIKETYLNKATSKNSNQGIRKR